LKREFWREKNSLQRRLFGKLIIPIQFAAEEKRAARYSFGLGKRRYDFGLGKRKFEDELNKRLPNRYNFGLGR
jgi:hypothetical protein